MNIDGENPGVHAAILQTERTRLLAFIAKGAEAERWLDLAHGWLLTNEFAFVD